MENFLRELPDRQTLLQWIREEVNNDIPEVNAHIHTPYSFSSFDDMRQAFLMAQKEQIKLLGINDFNTTGGYDEFHALSREFKVFPLFNIELIGLMEEEQSKGIRINDPINPGRIYLSGKGLDFPVNTENELFDKVDEVIEKGHDQVRTMINKLNQHLLVLDRGMQLDFREIQSNYARYMVRERHIAMALRLLIFDRFKTPGQRKAFLHRLYQQDAMADITSNAAIENEIRNRLLKAGGIAFVEEDPGTFLSLDEMVRIITGAGGIPCYPVLLDDKKGDYTEFESDPDALHRKLTDMNISCVELIPGRNDYWILKRYISFFSSKGFVILLGTEHNTPSAGPLKITARGGVPLDDEIRETAWKGACVVAAHQYLRARGVGEGFVSGSGTEKGSLEELGKAVIRKFIR